MSVSDKSENNEEDAIEMKKPTFVDIKDLEPENMGFSVHCRVYSVKRKLCREQLNGDIVRIYEAVIYDDSAAVTMTLKGEDQISAVKPGDNLTLRNVKVSMHNFHMRLACDRWGLIEKDNESRIKPQTDDEGNEKVPKNVSDQEYERVEDSVASEDNNNNTRNGSPRRRGRGRGRRGGRRGGPRRGGPYRGPYRGPRRGPNPFYGGRGRGRGRGGYGGYGGYGGFGGRPRGRGGYGGPRRGAPRSPYRGYY